MKKRVAQLVDRLIEQLAFLVFTFLVFERCAIATKALTIKDTYAKHHEITPT